MFGMLLLIIAIPLVLLGLHGFYVYFHPWEAIFTQEINKLFFAISVPSNLSVVVEWMSGKGFQSFFIPLIFTGIGIFFIWTAYKQGFQLNPSRSISNFLHSLNLNNTRNQRYHSKPKILKIIIKILLSMLILANIIVLFWYGNIVFSHQTSPLFGAIIFILLIVTLIFLIWFLRKKYLWYQPSFKLIVIILFVISIIFAFAGVEPFQEYKNSIFSGIF
jgi:hypothetical protein